MDTHLRARMSMVLGIRGVEMRSRALHCKGLVQQPLALSQQPGEGGSCMAIDYNSSIKYFSFQVLIIFDS